LPDDGDILDFRSDTITRPSAGMRQAMARAEVGDDVFGEDPTVRRLEQRAAELCGREAALLVPSGTMANLIGLALHCQRGDEVILERRTHSFSHEVGGGAALFGILFHPLESADGRLLPEQVEEAIRPVDVHQPRTRLVVVENSINLAGGLLYPFELLRRLRQLTRQRGLGLHLDGARIFNAAVASGVEPATWAAQVDTLSFCLSKGLGCPVGSLFVGDREQVDQARWLRKMLGGGMRQAGIIAAAGLYALEHNIARLAEDHARARELAAGLRQCLDERFRVQPVETNMVLIHTDSAATTETTLASWRRAGVLALAPSPTTIRLVTHLDIPAAGARQAVERISRATREQG